METNLEYAGTFKANRNFTPKEALTIQEQGFSITDNQEITFTPPDQAWSLEIEFICLLEFIPSLSFTGIILEEDLNKPGKLIANIAKGRSLEFRYAEQILKLGAFIGTSVPDEDC